MILLTGWFDKKKVSCDQSIISFRMCTSVLGLLIVPAVLQRTLRSAAGCPGWLARTGLTVCLCCVCVVFAPSPLGDNSHSAASSSPGQGPHKFISSGPSQVGYCSADLCVSFSELRRLQSHQPLSDFFSSFYHGFSSTDCSQFYLKVP